MNRILAGAATLIVTATASLTLSASSDEEIVARKAGGAQQEYVEITIRK